MRTPLLVRLVGAVVLVASTSFCQQSGEAQTEFQRVKAQAEQGDPRSQLHLGMLYRDGRGVEKNPQEELKWYRKAADKNDAWAQYEVGYTYEYGSGIAVPKDAVEAVKWYRKAAEQDHFQAQMRLAFCLQRGIGVPQDLVEAAKWYRVVAEYNHPEGKKALGDCYALGRGLEKNLVEAYARKILAADGAFGVYLKYVEERDEFAKQLTEQQLADGQKRAAELKPQVLAGAAKRSQAQMAAANAQLQADRAAAERKVVNERARIPLPARTGGTSSMEDFFRLTGQGSKLTPENAAELEAKLKQDPKDHWARLLLIGYRKKGEKMPADCVELVLGLVEHHPRAPGTGAFYIMLSFLYDRAALLSACTIWEKHVQAFPKDGQVLGNAAQWMSHAAVVEPKYRGEIKRLFASARAAEPDNPLWAERMGNILIAEAKGLKPPESAAAVRGGIEQFDAAMRLRKVTDRASYRLEHGQPYLAILTTASLMGGETNQAKAFARELLQALDPKRDALYHGDFTYQFNSLLGQIALREGKPDEAVNHLLAAGKSPGSPSLNSFGPSFTLAKELLQLGRPQDRITVGKFLDDVARFWANPDTARDYMKADKVKQREQIEAWKKEILDGKIPTDRKW